jgi:hypothetical protein
MSDHDDLLKQGPRQAPEPETAEQRTKRNGLKAAGGGVAAGGIGLAKAGLLSKIIFWLFLFKGVGTAAHIGGWLGLLLLMAVIGGAIYYRRHRSDAWRRKPDPDSYAGNSLGASSEESIPEVFQQPPGQEHVSGAADGRL